MIPFRDHNPSGRFPIVTVILIAANVLVFLYELLLSSTGQLEQFYYQAALIPANVTAALTPATALTFLTSMFMHGGWMHLIGNMLYLWIFGDNIEDILGSLGFVVFYLACGVAADVAHILIEPRSPVPTLGASGAIAGVLGAYLIMYPRARVDTLVFLGYFIRIISLPALVVLGFWFVLQLFNGLLSLGVPTGGGVAFFAHVGGFVAGLALMGVIRLLRPVERSY
jgi:membrane associated rhomboid family serine protease